MRFAVSTFETARDNSPRQLEVSWGRVLATKTTPIVRPELGALIRARIRDGMSEAEAIRGAKDRLKAWSPATFKPGATRSKETVHAVSMLVLDHDSGTDMDEAIERWSGLQLVAHTSFHHTEEKPKFRLVIPFAAPVSGALWPRVWAWAQSRSPDIDPTCKNADRIYFKPAIRDANWPFRSVVREGALLHVPDFPPPVEERPVRPVVRPPPFRSPDPIVRQHEMARRYREEPWCREQFARSLQMRLGGAGANVKAKGAACPKCGESSVWFFINPEKSTNAHCDHRNSCGWSAPLIELAGEAA